MSVQDNTEHSTKANVVVRQTFPLGAQWPTIDPFLFVAHHRDAYPEGNDNLGPVGSLAGRQIGQDFADIDGWNMYHGQSVPGFPQHPHRGFETITYVRQGIVDHSDSLGAKARYGHGDTQWLTAGAGIVHAEMFPLLSNDGPNPAELFQIWLNLPAENKMDPPDFKMFWSDQIPVTSSTDSEGNLTEVSVIAGRLGDAAPPSPPASSWAARDEADVAIWHIRLSAGASWELPAVTNQNAERVIYVFDGDHLLIDGERIDAGIGAIVEARQPLMLCAGGGTVEAMVLQGRPIDEPVARYGPFVMNTNEEIQQAFDDYRRTQFGGWPWPAHDPVHGRDERFAIHPDGSLDAPPTAG